MGGGEGNNSEARQGMSVLGGTAVGRRQSRGGDQERKYKKSRTSEVDFRKKEKIRGCSGGTGRRGGNKMGNEEVPLNALADAGTTCDHNYKRVACKKKQEKKKKRSRK